MASGKTIKNVQNHRICRAAQKIFGHFFAHTLLVIAIWECYTIVNEPETAKSAQKI
ncbi:MAG: hypothetical protein HFF69_10635 [Oscillospiraceae bacterium]|nr:hypothetical protein [Oscillospiraceae bacterium]